MSMNESLLDAARNGDTEAVKALIDAGAGLNAKDEDGWTALIWASEEGHTEIAKELISAGADVNAQDKDGRTVLM